MSSSRQFEPLRLMSVIRPVTLGVMASGILIIQPAAINRQPIVDLLTSFITQVRNRTWKYWRMCVMIPTSHLCG